MKITYHIKPKFFLRTKLLQNLLLIKYLISVAATLMENINVCGFLHLHVLPYNAEDHVPRLTRH